LGPGFDQTTVFQGLISLSDSGYAHGFFAADIPHGGQPVSWHQDTGLNLAQKFASQALIKQGRSGRLI
jgi:hypothetical protein